MNMDLTGIVDSMDVYESGEMKALVDGGLDGFMMGWSQEMLAAIKAGSFSGEKYEEELKKLETKKAKLQEAYPIEYGAGQVGGAVTNPAIIAPGTAAFKGAMKTVKNLPSFMRWLTGGAVLSGEGAVIGGIEGAGRSEPGQRTEGGTFGAKLGAILGLSGGAIGYGVGKGVGLAKRLKNWFTENKMDNLGKKAIAELEMYAKKENKTIDEFLVDVVKNKVPIIEMSDSMRQLAALIGHRSGGARDLLEKSVSKRADETLQNLKTETETTLSAAPKFEAFQNKNQMGTAPVASIDPSNMESSIRILNKDITDYINAAYTKAYKGNPQLGQKALGEVTLSVDLVNRLANNLNEVVKLQTLNKTPLIKINKNGEISYSRNPTLKEAEIVRKAIDDEAEPALGKKRNELQKGFKDREIALKGELDVQSPTLKTARDSSAISKLAQEGFKDTKGMFSKQTFDQFLDDYAIRLSEAEKYGKEGVDLVKKYYQYGMQNELNKELKKATRASFIKKLNDPETKEFKVINEIYPAGSLERLQRSLNQSSGALAAKDKIMAYSAGKDIGNVNSMDAAVNEMRNTAQAIRSSNLTTIAIDKVASGLKGLFGTKYGMSPSQFKLMAEFLTERRPEVAKKLLDGKFSGLPEDLDQIARFMVRGTAGKTSAFVQGQGYE